MAEKLVSASVISGHQNISHVTERVDFLVLLRRVPTKNVVLSTQDLSFVSK